MSDVKNKLIEGVQAVADAAEKLVIVTGKPGSGKSKVLRELADIQKWQYVDCKDLVTMADLQGVAADEKNSKAVEIMTNVFDNYKGSVLLLDKIQTLFSPSMGLDVMQVMKQASAKKPLVIAWPGYYEDNKLNFKNETANTTASYSVDGIKLFSVD